MRGSRFSASLGTRKEDMAIASYWAAGSRTVLSQRRHWVRPSHSFLLRSMAMGLQSGARSICRQAAPHLQHGEL